MLRQWAKLRAVITGRGRIENELERELEEHLHMEMQENLSRGMSPEDARETAAASFGNKTLIRESARNEWLFGLWEEFLQDAGYAVRAMRKRPAFATTAILTLGLGIGGNTAMFTVIRGVLLKPLSYNNPERLVRLSVENPRRTLVSFTPVRYEELKRGSRSFSEIGAFGLFEDVTLSVHGQLEQVKQIRISADFLDVLGVHPVLGRSFISKEDLSGGPDVAMISTALWRRRFGADPSIAGTPITLNSIVCTIVGVLPPDFAFPAVRIDVWLPRPSEWSMAPREAWNRTATLTGFGRLREGVRTRQAQSEMDILGHRYALAHAGMPDANRDSRMRVEGLADNVVKNVRSMLWILFAAVGCVLLIACANVASLLLARALSRSKEFSVRAALGAGRARLVRQLLTESLLMAVAGGMLGAVLAKVTIAAVLRMNDLDLPRAGEIRLDGIVLTFTAAVSVVTGVLFGLFPALRISKPDITDMLRDRSAETGHRVKRRSALGFTARDLLVIGQVSLSIMLLIGAALLSQSFMRLRAVDPGFEPKNLLTLQISLPPLRYDTNQKKAAFWEAVVQYTRSLPGVQDATVALTLPMSPGYAVALQPAGQTLLKLSERPIGQLESVTPGYFETLKIPIKKGRLFTAQDNTKSVPPVAIINEATARRFWPSYPLDQNPIAQHLIFGGSSKPVEIVGIVGDVHEYNLATDAGLEVYIPSSFMPPQTGNLAVKTVGEPMRMAEAIRATVHAIDANQTVSHLRAMEGALGRSIGQQRINVLLLGLFAGLALLLAVVGLYGVMAYSVAQRIQELSIRRALGAKGSDILLMVTGQGLRLASVGIVFGLLGAICSARVMNGVLFHVNAIDPITFFVVSALFILVAVAASCIPGYRAIRIEPVGVIR